VDDLRKGVPATVHVLHTSDDCAALNLVHALPGVRVSASTDGFLEVAAGVDTLDTYVIALGNAGIAVRTLERRVRSLESLFLELTDRHRVERDVAPSRNDGDGIQDERVAS
jgi:ABC-2 type transport system ATP-binding protein